MGESPVSRIIKAYRDPAIAKLICNRITELVKTLVKKEKKEIIKIMHVCGTHEHTITYYGIRDVLPETIKLIAGPGCPVCIVPAREIDEAVKIALEHDALVLSYGDMYRVPGSKMSLANARSMGGNVQVVYGFRDAVEKSRKTKGKAVFFAVGFETTQPTIASYVALNKIPPNMSILVSHRLTVPAVKYILKQPDIPLDGIIAPGHVSTITGAGAWSFIAEDCGLPVVVTGFEPIDVLLAVMDLLEMLVKGKPKIVNEYSRAVSWNGNVRAKEYILKVFKVVDADWRGIGVLPESGLALRETYSSIDARKIFNIRIDRWIDVKPGCRCPDIILGRAEPTDCPMFLRACTPEKPLGACMVSSEGTCAIWAKYGGYRRNVSIRDQ